MKRKKGWPTLGFTALELSLTVLIISVLASIAMTSFQRLWNQVRAVEALQNLDMIRSGEILYRTEYGSFSRVADTSSINETLNLSIVPQYFNYRVFAEDDTFLATASPAMPIGDLLSISMDHTGKVFYSYFSASNLKTGDPSGNIPNPAPIWPPPWFDPRIAFSVAVVASGLFVFSQISKS